MNNLMNFENEEFGQVRTMEVEGKPYFVAKDIAEILGYARPTKAIQDHCKGVLKQDIGVTTGFKADGTPTYQKVEMSIIPEGDIYRLIIKSKLPKAEKFEAWVMDTVLPQIRKTGSYMTEIKGQEKMFQLMRNEINETVNSIVTSKVKEIEEKCSDYYRPSSFDKTNITNYIKKRLGITKANEEYELVKQRILLKLGGTKWEDIPVEELRESLNIIDESIRIVKLDRPTQQLSMFY